MKILLAKWVSDRCARVRLFTLTLVNRQVLIPLPMLGIRTSTLCMLEMLSLNDYLTIAA